jgi:hypothetical protein
MNVDANVQEERRQEIAMGQIPHDRIVSDPACQRDADPLAHAARELVRIAIDPALGVMRRVYASLTRPTS